MGAGYVYCSVVVCMYVIVVIVVVYELLYKVFVNVLILLSSVL